MWDEGGADNVINHHEENGIVIVPVNYDLAEHTVTTFREDLQYLVDLGKIYFILDLEKVSYITSMGQSVLCAMKKELDPKGGWIRLAKVDKELLEILSITRLTDLFDLFDSVEEALAYNP